MSAVPKEMDFPALMGHVTIYHALHSKRERTIAGHVTTICFRSRRRRSTTRWLNTESPKRAGPSARVVTIRAGTHSTLMALRQVPHPALRTPKPALWSTNHRSVSRCPCWRSVTVQPNGPWLTIGATSSSRVAWNLDSGRKKRSDRTKGCRRPLRERSKPTGCNNQ